MSSLKCCVAKSAAQISSQLSTTQLGGGLSGVLAICPLLISNKCLTPMVEAVSSCN